MSVDDRHVEELFYAALECPTESARLALLAERCQSNPALRQRLDKLLAAYDGMHDFLATPTLPLVTLTSVIESDEEWEADGSSPVDAAAIHAPRGALPVGSVIDGRYRLVEVLGEGGMGTVYRAEQTAPVVRQVAVKLLKPEIASAAVVLRFEAERQALAVMDHENIARVFDGGATVEGYPFFVMELVPGIPINRYCDEHHLSIFDRIRLFIPVCEALQHAHQKGIIHRDLKPGNVLVASQEKRAIPKVIDFGVAKAIGQPLSLEASATAFGVVVGTPEYMSPEQACLEQIDVDTRSDVYSLGALLYELLVGAPPFGRYGIDHDSLLGMLLLIREGVPVGPSHCVRLAGGAPAIARARDTTPARLSRLLHGELDAIVLKCLKNSRDERYATARELADELFRFLNGQPIRARTAGPVERFCRWCRHNSTVAGLGAAVFLSLLAGISTSVYFAISASQRAVAEADARQSERQEWQRAQEQTRRAEQARAEGLLQLARALRTSGRSGQRFGALCAIRESLTIAGPSRELADEAASALCLPDWEVDFEWNGYPDDTEAFALSPTFDRYAVAHVDGRVTIANLPDDRLLAEFPGLGRHSDYCGLRFSDDGSLLLERCDGDQARIRCWKIDGAEVRVIYDTPGGWAAISFDSHYLAAAVGDRLQIWDLAVERRMASLDVGPAPSDLAFAWAPHRHVLVIKSNNHWRHYDVENGSLGRWHENLQHITSAPAVHPNGQWAVLPVNPPVECRIVDLATGGQVAPGFARHHSAGVALFMSRVGDVVFSGDWSATLRMWDPTSGRELLTRSSSANRNGIVVSPDNTRVGPEIVTNNRVRTLRFASARELTKVPLGQEYSPKLLSEYHRFQQLDRSGRILAATTVEGVSLIDTETGVTVARLETAHPQGMQATAFLGDGTLVTYGAEGLQLWPLEFDVRSGTLTIGHPDRTLAAWRAWQPLDSHSSREGTVIALQAEVIDGARTDGAAVIHTGRDPEWPARYFAVAAGTDVKSVSVSPDGRFTATGVWSGAPGVGRAHATVWDKHGNPVAELPSHELCRVKFSPSGDRLLVFSAENFECRIYRTDDWSCESTHAAKFVPLFSPDETLCAFAGETGEISLRYGHNLQEFALLQSPFDEALVPVAITPGNGRLYAAGTETHELYCFHLALIRQELEVLGLASGWIKIIPPASAQGSPPLRVVRQPVIP